MDVAAVLIAVVALAAAARHPDWAAVVAAPALLLCLWAALTLPDLDRSFALGHRSGVTHSAAPAAAALLRRWAWPAAAGLALGLALHLSADFFPNAMTGYATVKLPGAGSIGATASYWWIGLNALACAVAGGWLAGLVLPPHARALALFAAALIGIAYLAGADGGWWVLLLLLLLLGAGALLRRAEA